MSNENDNLTIGDVMDEGKTKAVKGIVILLAILVYIAGVIYAEVHGFSILTAGIDPDMLLWAIVGVLALGVSAIGLPLALHFWTHDPAHRIAAFIFYAVDIALMALNAMTDFSTRSGASLAEWQVMYLDYVAATTPIICAVGWGLLLLMDPSQKERQVKQALKAAVQTTLANRLAMAAKSAAVNSAVDQAAAAMAADIISKQLGVTVSGRRPAQIIDAQPNANTNGRGAPGWMFWRKKARRGATATYEQQAQAVEGNQGASPAPFPVVEQE